MRLLLEMVWPTAWPCAWEVEKKDRDVFFGAKAGGGP